MFSRDHRKLLVVDDQVGFVGGLGVGDSWVGDRQRRREPWRDTGVEIGGPAVAELAQAFVDNWIRAGGEPRLHECPISATVPDALGDAYVRVIATDPTEAGLYRLDTLVASAARQFLWLTDAYFIATNSYVQALAASARDGVDVRLLLPGTSDMPLVRALSVVGYRPLLEAGVRIFEWNGTMLHAKTAVADGAWARIGSSNLNPVSWWRNWELDVAIEDDALPARSPTCLSTTCSTRRRSCWTRGVVSPGRNTLNDTPAVGGDVALPAPWLEPWAWGARWARH